MKTALAVFFLCLGSALAQVASTTRGVINDPDGFTNLRAKPGENAAVVARVKSGEVFEFESPTAQSETWWKVTLASGKTGWMHSSRIRLFVVPEDIVVEENNDANTHARADGVDYIPLVRAAAKGDQAAMQQFFGLGMDGSAAEIYVDVVIKMIHILGDDKMAKLLSRQSASYRQQVAGWVTDDNGLPPFEPIPYMKRHFPKTAKLLFPARPVAPLPNQ